MYLRPSKDVVFFSSQTKTSRRCKISFAQKAATSVLLSAAKSYSDYDERKTRQMLTTNNNNQPMFNFFDQLMASSMILPVVQGFFPQNGLWGLGWI